jgi:hypothetical protein
MIIHAYTCSSRNLPHFTVSGGPLNTDFRYSDGMLMGWHFTREDGSTAGVARDSDFVEATVKALRVMELLKQASALYHLGERRDQGYMDELSQKKWDELKELLS